MPNNSIPDWKKAAIAGMSVKYGDASIGKRLGISRHTVKKYREKVQDGKEVQMEGINMVANK